MVANAAMVENAAMVVMLTVATVEIVVMAETVAMVDITAAAVAASATVVVVVRQKVEQWKPRRRTQFPKHRRQRKRSRPRCSNEPHWCFAPWHFVART